MSYAVVGAGVLTSRTACLEFLAAAKSTYIYSGVATINWRLLSCCTGINSPRHLRSSVGWFTDGGIHIARDSKSIKKSIAGGGIRWRYLGNVYLRKVLRGCLTT